MEKELTLEQKKELLTIWITKIICLEKLLPVDFEIKVWYPFWCFLNNQMARMAIMDVTLHNFCKVKNGKNEIICPDIYHLAEGILFPQFGWGGCFPLGNFYDRRGDNKDDKITETYQYVIYPKDYRVLRHITPIKRFKSELKFKMPEELKDEVERISNNVFFFL